MGIVYEIRSLRKVHRKSKLVGVHHCMCEIRVIEHKIVSTENIFSCK